MRNNKKRERDHSRNSGARYETCKECGREWNVSIKAEIPWTGYLCPQCREKFRRIMNR